MKKGDTLTPKSELIFSTAPGMKQELQASLGPEENTSQTSSERPSQSAQTHTQSLPLALDKKNIFSWYAAVFSDDSTERTTKNTETNRQDQEFDVHNDGKMDKSFLVDENKIADALAKMHSSLCTSEFKRYREYRKCPTGTVQEVNARLVALMKEDEQARCSPKTEDSARRQNGNDSTEHDSPESDHLRYLSANSSDSEAISTIGRNSHLLLKRKRKFVRIMKKLFQLFLPLRYSSEMIVKYWGAVDLLLQVLISGFMTTRRKILTFSAEQRHLHAMA